MYNAQKKYNESNTLMKAIRLNINTDEDILDYLSDKQFQPEVKRLIRLEIERRKNGKREI